MSSFVVMAHEAGSPHLGNKNEAVPRLVLRTDLTQFSSGNPDSEPMKGISDHSVSICSTIADREMFVNTIEVSTEELINIGEINSDEIEYIYSSNIVEPGPAINENLNVQEGEVCEIRPIESLSLPIPQEVGESKIRLHQLPSYFMSENDKSKTQTTTKYILQMPRNLLVQNENPLITEVAAVAHQVVTADLNSQNSLVSQDPNHNTRPPNKKPVTVKVDVPGGSQIHLQKFYCQPGLCRVCLLVKENLSSIFEDVSIDSNGLIENSRGPNAAHKFNLIPVLKTLLDIEVAYNDGLSDLICSDCYDQLMTFSVYRKRIALGQTRLDQILDHVKNSTTPTFIPPLGEADMQKTDIYRHAPLIVTANKMIKNSQYSHLVLRNLSDRTWDKIFMLMSSMIGYNSGKLKNLEHYATDYPYVIGFFCYSCNSTIHGTKDDYAKHFKSFHGIKSSTDVNYPCDVCGNNYPLSDTSQNYSEHWLQHFFSHECDICNKKLPSSRGLWIHKKSAHGKKKGSFTCDEKNCNKSFNKKSLLNDHKLNHKKSIIASNQIDNQTSTWTQDVACDKSGNENTCIVLNVEQVWTCDECQSTFNQQDLLLEHKASIHMTFGCKDCGKTFKTLDAQEMHQSHHTAENRLTCKVCNKKCSSVHGLKSHMVKHQDWGNFPCSDCGKVFKRAGSLTDHKRTHTGETPFACSLCNKSFRMKSNYFKHMRIHKRKEQKKSKPH